MPHCETTRKLAIDLLVVRGRSRINFWSGTPRLAGRILNNKFNERHVDDVRGIASVQLGLVDGT